MNSGTIRASSYFATFSPVLDPVGEVLRLVEEVLSEGVIGDELDIAALVQLASAVVLLPEHHADAQVLDGPDHVLVSQQEPPNPAGVLLLYLPC